ncbi:LysR family transcriptional regulator [Glycomyces tarimensis]
MSDSGTAPDLDLRLVRYFTKVVQHRHFGRAAAELYVNQPSLSRQIRKLEQQLGARLLHRTPQGCELTDAGEAFLPRAEALLRSAAGAVAAARSAVASRITVGYMSGIIVTSAVRELRRRYPDAEVNAVHLAWNEPRAALLDHRVDAAVVRLPIRGDQLDVTTLYEEPRAVLLPLDHRLAGKESVRLGDIAHEPLPRLPDPDWDAYWRIDPRPDGSRAPDGPFIEAIEDKFEVIASGQAIAIVSGGVRSEGFRSDLTTVPLRDVEPSHVALVTRAGDANRLLETFGELATAYLGADRSPNDQE